MANFGNVKKLKKKGLGVPPSADETVDNLEEPETAPATIQATTRKVKPVSREVKTGRVGRPISNRTAKITTTLTPEFKKRLKLLSVSLDRDMGDIIEEAVVFWEKRG